MNTTTTKASHRGSKKGNLVKLQTTTGNPDPGWTISAFTFQIVTGGDDKRADSLVQAAFTYRMANGQNNTVSCDLGEGVDWNNWTLWVQSITALGEAGGLPNDLHVGDIISLELKFASHAGGIESPDNWDLKTLSVSIACNEAPNGSVFAFFSNTWPGDGLRIQGQGTVPITWPYGS